MVIHRLLLQLLTVLTLCESIALLSSTIQSSKHSNMDSNKLLYKNFSQQIEPRMWNLSYAPYSVLCPSHSLIRQANETLCKEEQTYISNRNLKTEPFLKSLLYHNKIPKFDIESFFSNKSKPTIIALAFSGGGYRSMLSGAGILSSLDCRNPDLSPLGGILQASTYIGGISGGSWLVMSNFVNDFVPIHGLVNSRNDGWNLQDLLLLGVPNFDPGDVQRHILEKLSVSMGNETAIKRKEQQQPVGFFGNILRFFSFGKTNLTIPISEQVKDGGIEEEDSTLLYTWVRNLFSKPKGSAAWNATNNLNKEIALKEYLKFYKELLIEVKDKKRAGYHTSLTDYWGRALARRIFTSQARTPGVTITAATESLGSFLNYEQPFPIIGTVEKDPGQLETSSLDSHVFEFTPYEFGSWDSYLNAFVPIKYLGSHLNNGKSIHKTDNENYSYCTSGFDNVGFITGTSSSLFNHIFVYVYKLLNNFQLETTLAIESILKSFGLSSEWKSLKSPQLHPDYALYSPNPFYQFISGDSSSTIAESSDLYLVDGGDDGQNIPFQPFLRSARKVDIIIAFDMSCERDNFPNGTVLQKTSNRYKQLNNTHVGIQYFQVPNTSIIKSIFPRVPTPEEIVRDGLVGRPLFLGCDILRDYETLEPVVTGSLYKEMELPPVVVYYSNYNYSFAANTSTFQLSYNKEEVNGMINNGYNLATFMNSTLYPICLNCIILKREFDRIQYGSYSEKKKMRKKQSDFVIPKTCETCYEVYCWR